VVRHFKVPEYSVSKMMADNIEEQAGWLAICSQWLLRDETTSDVKTASVWQQRIIA